MRVAIVAPVFGKTGGPELGTIQLADALVNLGVDVTLFAPADFPTRAKLHPILHTSLWSFPNFSEQTEEERKELIKKSQSEIISHQEKYDIIHLSSQRYAYEIVKQLHIPTLLTLHNKISVEDMRLLRTTPIRIVTLTKKYQNAIGADAFIYPGIPLSEIVPSFSAGNGLITIGRITEQKGISEAITIAQKANKPLTIIGRIGNTPERQAYYREKVGPFLGKDIRHIESLPNHELLTLLSQSEALLFPIVRPETFGRVSAEALASGTPVIGSLTDPLPEVLNSPDIAFLSDSLDELADAALHTKRFNRQSCRRYAEEKFNIRVSAQKYIDLYQNILQEK